jgi:hypothetical protein
MKVLTQCNQACSKANRMLGLIKRTIKCKTKDIMLCLYKSLIARLKCEALTGGRCPLGLSFEKFVYGTLRGVYIQVLNVVA